MELRSLGGTDLRVTALGYGAMELRRMADEAEVARLLNEVLDSGIRFIDTSPDYGLSEAYIGRVLAGRRHEYVLATKCGCVVDAAGNSQGAGHVWTAEQLEANLDSSLRLLRTDVIDLWQLHGTPPEALPGGPDDAVIAALQAAKAKGKVRAIGISFINRSANDPWYPAEYSYRHIQEYLSWGVFDTMQTVYGGLTRTCELAVGKAAERGIGVIARGLLKRYFTNYDALCDEAGLDELREPGETRNGFLIRYALSHPSLSAAIVGSGNPAHVRENVAAASRGPLAEDVYAEAQRRLAAVGIAPKPA